MSVYMFHYVHKKDNGYKFYELEKFESFIKSIKQDKKILSLSDFCFKFKNGMLNENDILLTFDDGTIDHYMNVYPILKKYKLSGTFFLCSDCFNNIGLLPNKIHKLLAERDFEKLFSQFYYIYVQEVIKKNIILKPEKETVFDKNQKVRFFKQSLQYRLPITVSDNILKKLYDINDLKFDCSDYYIKIENAKEMLNDGMCFGAHTKSHKHLEYLDYENQKYEITENIKYLKENQLINDVLAFSYPYGSYNDDTINILENENVDIAFLADNRITRIEKYKFPRIDCRYLNI